MSGIAFDNHAAFSYQLRLPSFEGPLDVLLKLIERQHLPISDVSLVMVSEQFLVAARELGAMRPESLAEFAAVGARLVAMKARSLLPRPQEDADVDEQPSDLVVQLIEYRAIKTAAVEFAALDRAGNAAFSKGLHAIELPEKPRDLPLARHEPQQLVRAIGRRLVSNRSISRLVTVRPMLSLRVMVDRLLGVLGTGTQSFHSIANQTCSSSHEQRTLFLAMLVMVRRNVLEAQQLEPFGDISLRYASNDLVSMSQEIEEFS